MAIGGVDDNNGGGGGGGVTNAGRLADVVLWVSECVPTRVVDALARRDDDGGGGGGGGR